MKTFLTATIAFCLFALTCSAQWSPTTPNIYNTNTGNVGIGITAPASKLTVFDTVNLQVRIGGVSKPGLNPAMRWTGRNVADNANRAADIQLDADAGLFNFFAPANSTPVVKAISILTGGNVGIGTTSPGSPLHINSTTGLSATGNTVLTIQAAHSSGTLGSGGVIRFTNNLATSDAAAIRTATEGASAVGLRFQTGYGTGTLTDRMTIDNVGNVGIGTTTPADKMEVAGNILLSRGADRTFGIPDPTTSTIGNNLTVKASSGGTGGAARVGGNLNLTAGSPYSGSALNGASGNVVITAGTNTGVGSGGGAIMFNTGKPNIEAMRIDAAGKIGIGTATPTALFDVSSATGTATIVPTELNITSTNSASDWDVNNPWGVINFYSKDASGMGASPRASIGALMSTTSGTSGIMAFYTSTGTTLTERMRVDNNGKVGIGTMHPDQALTVKGQVHSTSVLIESTVPADYVFNTDYNLRPLTEVKAFVDKNHHLPEVPSAAEFKKNGMNVGEMNMTLLKKIEELTLYMIEKDKQLEEQKKIISQQNERLKKLEENFKTDRKKS